MIQRGKPVAAQRDRKPHERVSVRLGGESEDCKRRRQRPMASRIRRPSRRRTAYDQGDWRRRFGGDRQRHCCRRRLALLRPVEHGISNTAHDGISRGAGRSRCRSQVDQGPAAARRCAAGQLPQILALAARRSGCEGLLRGLLFHGRAASRFPEGADRRDRLQLGRHADPRVDERGRGARFRAARSSPTSSAVPQRPGGRAPPFR